MAFLTIAAVDYDVIGEGANRLQDIDVGNRNSRAFAGNLRVSVRAVKRQWEFALAPMAPAAVTTLRTNIALGAIVACSGTLLGGAVNCQVTITGEEFIQDGSNLASYQSLLRVHVEES
jgi:hypothetical protein